MTTERSYGPTEMTEIVQREEGGFGPTEMTEIVGSEVNLVPLAEAIANERHAARNHLARNGRIAVQRKLIAHLRDELAAPDQSGIYDALIAQGIDSSGPELERLWQVYETLDELLNPDDYGNTVAPQNGEFE